MHLDLTVLALLWELGPIFFGSTEDLISWLQGKGLLSDSDMVFMLWSTNGLGKRGDVSDVVYI